MCVCVTVCVCARARVCVCVRACVCACVRACPLISYSKHDEAKQRKSQELHSPTRYLAAYFNFFRGRGRTASGGRCAEPC